MATCPKCRKRYPDEVAVCEADGSTLVDDAVVAAADRPISPGDMLGEYRVESKLGEGGFGAVFRAVHPLIGKTVAIKVLSRRYSSDPEMVSRFVSEARAVNQIKNKNIIDIFAFGALPDGRQFYVMELLDGITLDRHVDRLGRLSPEEALPILGGVARALDAAHAAGIAHRDLKPENVFLAIDEDHGFVPKLLDFGIAKLFGEPSREHQTRTGVPLGTPYYMSPEQCRGHNVDHRTDVYSFGILSYKLLTGTLPFGGEAFMDVMFKHVSEPAPPVSSQVRGLEALDAAVAHMLEKDPAKRPETLRAAVEELAAAARSAGHVVELPREQSGKMRSGEGFASMDATLPVGMTPSELHAIASADTLARATTASVGTPSLQTRPRRGGWAIGAVVGVAVVAAATALALRSKNPAASASTASMVSSTSEPAAPPSPPPPPRSAAPEVAPADVELSVESEPKNAEVFLGDEKLGTAPGPFRIKRGTDKLEIVLKAPGYAAGKVSFLPTANGVVSTSLKKVASTPQRGHPGKPELEF